MKVRTGTYRLSPGALEYPTGGGATIRLIPNDPASVEKRLEDVAAAMGVEVGSREAETHWHLLMLYVLWDEPHIAWDLELDPDEVNEMTGETLRDAIEKIERELNSVKSRRVFRLDDVIIPIAAAARGLSPAVVERIRAKREESVAGESQAE